MQAYCYQATDEGSRWRTVEQENHGADEVEPWLNYNPEAATYVGSLSLKQMNVSLQKCNIRNGELQRK